MRAAARLSGWSFLHVTLLTAHSSRFHTFKTRPKDLSWQLRLVRIHKVITVTWNRAGISVWWRFSTGINLALGTLSMPVKPRRVHWRTKFWNIDAIETGWASRSAEETPQPPYEVGGLSLSTSPSERAQLPIIDLQASSTGSPNLVGLNLKTGGT